MVECGVRELKPAWARWVVIEKCRHPGVPAVFGAEMPRRSASSQQGYGATWRGSRARGPAEQPCFNHAWQ